MCLFYSSIICETLARLIRALADHWIEAKKMNDLLINCWPFCSFLSHVLNMWPQPYDANVGDADMDVPPAYDVSRTNFTPPLQHFGGGALFPVGRSGVRVLSTARGRRMEDAPFDEELPQQVFNSFLAYWFTGQQLDKLHKFYSDDKQTPDIFKVYTAIEACMRSDVHLSHAFVQLLNVQQLLVFCNKPALPVDVMLTQFERQWSAAFGATGTAQRSKKYTKSQAELMQTLIDFCQNASTHPFLATRNFARFTDIFVFYFLSSPLLEKCRPFSPDHIQIFIKSKFW